MYRLFLPSGNEEIAGICCTFPKKIIRIVQGELVKKEGIYMSNWKLGFMTFCVLATLGLHDGQAI